MKPSKQSKELAGALAEDQKRQAVDAAKKRAVAQQVDYDTFKKMVSACVTDDVIFSSVVAGFDLQHALCRYL